MHNFFYLTMTNLEAHTQNCMKDQFTG